MATLLQALRTHGQNLVCKHTATMSMMGELVAWLGGRTGLIRDDGRVERKRSHGAAAERRANGAKRSHGAAVERRANEFAAGWPSARRRPPPTHSRRSDPNPHRLHAMSVSAQADTWPKATQPRIHSLGAQRLHRVNAYG
jgi:hypothetical protein